jgi:hypothetical protein
MPMPRYVTYPKYGKATTDAVFVIQYQFKHIGVTNMLQSLAVDIAQKMATLAM